MDLNQIKGTHRERLIRIGREWGSPQVKDQAHAILGQLQDHQPTLEAHGLPPADVTELAAWVALYPAQLDARDDKQLGNKLTARHLQALITEASTARRVARLRLTEAAPRLAASPDADTPDSATAQALRHVQAVLDKTSRKPQDDAAALAAQLTLLANTLTLPPVAAITQPRGGVAALTALHKAEAALSQAVAAMAQRTSTTPQTEALDLLDGLIVERLREISRVAKEAAKATGSPALAAAFRLKRLYG